MLQGGVAAGRVSGLRDGRRRARAHDARDTLSLDIQVQADSMAGMRRLLGLLAPRFRKARVLHPAGGLVVCRGAELRRKQRRFGRFSAGTRIARVRGT